MNENLAAVIVDVAVYFLRYPFPCGTNYVYSAGTVDCLDVAIVKVTTNGGEYGLGEITHGAFCQEPITGLITHFKRMLVGEPVMDFNRTWEAMYGSSLFWNRQGIGIGVMGGINMALHDLAGKLLGVPVYQLLGGKCRSAIRAYASNGLFDNAEQLIADAQRAAKRGFNAYKMRAIDPDNVIDLVDAFYGNVQGMDLIVDAVQGSCAVPWTTAAIRQMARRLEKYPILWLEEPRGVEDIEGYVEVRRDTCINIAGIESLPTAKAFREYLDRDAFSIVQFDIATSGFTEGLRIASLAAAHAKPVAIHSWGTAISAAAALHMALALPNCAMTEFCFMDHPLNGHLWDSALEPVNGRLCAPMTAGLGVRWDESLPLKYPSSPMVSSMIRTDEKDMLLTARAGRHA